MLFRRRLYAKVPLYAAVVVVFDIGLNHGNKLLTTIELSSIISLTLQDRVYPYGRVRMYPNRVGFRILAGRENHRRRGYEAAEYETQYILSKSKGAETMTELIWFTVGFVSVLVIITAADTIVRCSAK